jgi:cell division protease FtsH
MSDELGPLSYAKGEEHIFLGREIAQHRDYSEETAKKIDQEINSLIDNAYNKSKQILNDNLDILHALADRLLEKETVLGKELDELIRSMRPGFEFPSKGLKDEKKEQDAQAQPRADIPADTESSTDARDKSDVETTTESETET